MKSYFYTNIWTTCIDHNNNRISTISRNNTRFYRSRGLYVSLFDSQIMYWINKKEGTINNILSDFYVTL